MKKNNKKGFTLMEMLIVVAIIAVLVAIAIPSFTSSLQKAKEAADEANIRGYYAQMMVAYADGNSTEYLNMCQGYNNDGTWPALNYPDQLLSDEWARDFIIYKSGVTQKVVFDFAIPTK